MSDLLCWRIEAAFAGSWRDILVGNADTLEWTDLTPAVRMVDGVDATRGRTSEDGNVSAGSLRFRLNNDDGAFTPSRPDLLSDWIAATFDSVDDFVAAYPEFLLSPDRVALHGRPIRLVYDPGTDVVLWTGVVESVESGWSSGIRGFATVRAVDAAAYAGRVTMRALPVAGLTAVEPYVRWVYPLDERDAPCLDLVGPDGYGMSAAPLLAHSIGTPGVIGAELTFEGASPGSIPGEAESTVPVFTGASATSGWCLDTKPRPLFDLPDLQPDGFGSAVSLWVWPGQSGRARTAVAVLGSGTSSLTIRVTSTNLPQAVIRDAGLTLTLTGATPLLAGQWAHLCVNIAYDSGTAVDVDLLVDGTSVATGSLAAPMVGLGRRQIIVGAGDNLSEPWDGRLANVAAHATTLGGPVLDWIVAAGNGGQGELSTERADRVLYAAGAWSAFDATATEGASTMCPQHTKGQSLAAALDVVAQAESASWWVLPTGPIRMGSRADYWDATPAVTLPAITVDAATGFTADEADVVNTVTVTRPGGATVTRRNTESIAWQGERSGGTVTLHVASDAQAEAYADDVVARYAWPTPRTSTLAVDVLTTQATVDPGDVLAVDVDQVVAVTGLPADAPDTDLEFVALGITDRITADAWIRTFNVGRSELLSDVWILGTSELDDTTILAL